MQVLEGVLRKSTQTHLEVKPKNKIWTSQYRQHG